MPNPYGILLIDKEVGPTSHDIIYQVRKRLGEKRVGHAGTLDPFASGLMVVFVGECTRLQDMFLFQDKTYEGEIAFGTSTDTEDLTGKILDSVDMDKISFPHQDVVATLIREKFIGEIQQRPPIFSAIHVAGERSYDLARQGEAVVLEERTVNVLSFEILELNKPFLKFRTRVGSGTYIRSLARDIGIALGIPVHLHALRRTMVGDLSVTQTKKISDLTLEDLKTHLGLIENNFNFLTRVEIGEDGPEKKWLQNGQFEFLIPQFVVDGYHAVTMKGEPVQIYERLNGALKLRFNLLKK
jgi:tRNA pseudouridine55 synthase